MKKLGYFLSILIILGGFAYLYWTSTPFYALQEAGMAVREHNVRKFRQCVDLNTLVESALKDLLFEPTTTTPGLTDIQRKVIVGACCLAKIPIEKALVYQIEKAITKNSSYPTTKAQQTSRLTSEKIACIKGTLREIVQVTSQELVKENKKLKEITYNRIQQYLNMHPDLTVSKLWNLPKDQQGMTIKNLLREYGFAPSNFRGFSTNTTSNNITMFTAKFFSPKLGKEIAVNIELVKRSQIPFGSMQIHKISNIKELIELIEPNYTQQVQGLVTYTLSDVTKQKVLDEVKDVYTNIKEAPATRKFFERYRNAKDKLKLK